MWPMLDGVTVDASSPTPLYLQLRQGLRRAIDAGRLAAGQALPGERDLAAAMGLSRVTVRKAIGSLVGDGILTQRQGAGTFVTARVEQKLSVLSSFSEDMRARGLAPGSIVLERGQDRPAPEEATALQLAPGELVTRLSRVRTADGRPMAIERAVVPARFLAAVDGTDFSLYQALGRVDVRPVRAVERLRAVSIKSPDAARLGIEEGAAALDIERRSFLPDGTPVEFTRSLYRGDLYDFIAEMRT